MSTGHGGARPGAGRKRGADTPPPESTSRPGPGRPRKADMPRTGQLMAGTGVCQ
jgi:hypothetical protein